ncbi:MAG TPA: ATP-binding protein, partial [Chthoniobacterales bacterium]
LAFELDSDLLDALNGLAKSTAYEHQIDCRFESKGSITLPRDVANHLYWIAREAVVNSIKHSIATKITICLDQCADRLQLSVKDNGLGVSESNSGSTGIGMKVMQQRAQLTGGSLTVGSNSPHGTVVCCEIPMNY